MPLCPAAAYILANPSAVIGSLCDNDIISPEILLKAAGSPNPSTTFLTSAIPDSNSTADFVANVRPAVSAATLATAFQVDPFWEALSIFSPVFSVSSPNLLTASFNATTSCVPLVCAVMRKMASMLNAISFEPPDTDGERNWR